ncbi:alpha/beta fold hydrolase [bacterium]|nr:alpha/beta fold hydrolase [bacterium]
MEKYTEPFLKDHSCRQSKLKLNNTACLLIHGFTGTPWAMKDLAHLLENYNIITSVPLLPGHGSSPAALNESTWTDWVDTARDEYLKLKSKYDKVFIAGHSIGGAIALLLAAEHSVDGVISLSTPYNLEDRRLPLLPLILPFASFWKKRSAQQHTGDGECSESGYNCYPLKAVLQCQGLLKEMRKNLSSINCPVLLMHSRLDYRISAKQLSKIARHIGSDVILIRYLRHAAHTITKSDDSETVFQTVRDFITMQSLQ